MCRLPSVGRTPSTWGAPDLAGVFDTQSGFITGGGWFCARAGSEKADNSTSSPARASFDSEIDVK
eukprot:2277866-Rhodomonas_salina.1